MKTLVLNKKEKFNKEGNSDLANEEKWNDELCVRSIQPQLIYLYYTLM